MTNNKLFNLTIKSLKIQNSEKKILPILWANIFKTSDTQCR